MKKREKVVYEKRSQKDYSMSFKWEVVAEIETGLLATLSVKRKHPTFQPEKDVYKMPTILGLNKYASEQ